jgi:hypothetical protein
VTIIHLALMNLVAAIVVGLAAAFFVPPKMAVQIGVVFFAGGVTVWLGLALWGAWRNK